MPQQINKRWFQNQMELKNISQRGLSTELKLDPSAMSLVLSGKRRLQIDEAAKIAAILEVPVEDVLLNAGLKVPTITTDGPQKVHVTGYVDEKFRIHFDAKKIKHRVVPAPIRELTAKDAGAVRFQTAGTSLDNLDGALVYYNKNISTLHADALGRLCVVRTNDDVWVIGVLKRGYVSGTHSVYTLAGEPVLEDIQVLSAAPVVWMKL